VIEVESVDFVSLPSRNIQRARRFYLETLGLPLETDTPVGFEVKAGQVTLSVWEPEKVGVPFAPNPNDVAFRVKDVEASRKTLEQKGVKFKDETLDSGVCHMAFFEDPDGNALMLHRRYAPRD
jgi:catechol 2,3-dioxygenase-like lactoylglutathione lyase family enzyme